MITEILRKLTALSNTTSVTNRQFLAWARRVVAQRSQTAMLESLRGNKEFDSVQSQRPLYAKMHKSRTPYKNKSIISTN